MKCAILDIDAKNCVTATAVTDGHMTAQAKLNFNDSDNHATLLALVKGRKVVAGPGTITKVNALLGCLGQIEAGECPALADPARAVAGEVEEEKCPYIKEMNGRHVPPSSVDCPISSLAAGNPEFEKKYKRKACPMYTYYDLRQKKVKQ